MPFRTAACATLVVAVTIGVQDAHAQEPRFGLVMGYPAAIGVLWRAGDRVALRPELTLDRSSSDTDTFPLGQPERVSGTSWQVGVGLSGLFYLGPADSLRTYLSPRIGYSRAETSPAGRLPATESEFSASGSLGAQYTLSDRFGVFGEVGVRYGRREATSEFPFGRTKVDSSSLSVRSGVGIVFYF